MERLKAAYDDLYESLRNSKWEKGFTMEQMNSEYTPFTAVQGIKYWDCKDKNGENFKFMLIGRAINGWDEYRSNPDAILTKEVFIESSIKNLINHEDTITHGVDRFEWIDTTNNMAKNVAREGIDCITDIGNYSLKRSQIWSYTKEIWESLKGEETEWSDRWFENIVWSNLYKISPHKEGNPSGWLMRREKEACQKLLQAEIDYFRPTHIFIATARDGWYERFATIFDDRNDNVGTNKMFEGNKEYVEATACYRYDDGGTAKVVVACRPEGRPKYDYVKQIVDFFEKDS